MAILLLLAGIAVMADTTKPQILWTEFEGHQKLGIGINDAAPTKGQEFPIFLYATTDADKAPAIQLDHCSVNVDTTKIPKGDPPTVTFVAKDPREWKPTESPHTWRIPIRLLKVNRTGDYGISITVTTDSGDHTTKSLTVTVSK